MKYQVPVLVEPLEEGGYYAECPSLPGCHVEGANYWEALENLEDVVRIHIEGRLEFGDPLPTDVIPMQESEHFKLQLPVMVAS
ncbi:MAG TPA: type II toxin-antitoxin system HicB family antitoxin [Gammaproteobacteria bacterium]|nr:type II toxin-antitoxin system HicB family antitoxin [Gammaproteobacteria bacterium]